MNTLDIQNLGVSINRSVEDLHGMVHLIISTVFCGHVCGHVWIILFEYQVINIFFPR